MARFLTGDKNVDREILLKLDNIEIMTFCKTRYGLELCNEDFFRNYLMRNYPNIYYTSRNNREKSWKQIYLENMFYIGELERKYRLIYTPEYLLSPQQILYFIRDVNRRYQNEIDYGTESIINILFVESLKTKDKALIQRYINAHPDINAWARAFAESIHTRNLDLFKFLMEKAGEDIPISLYEQIYERLKILQLKEFIRVFRNILIEKRII